MAATVTLTTSTGAATYTLSTGARGPVGAVTDAQIIAALDGVELEVASIKLTNTGAITKAAGNLGLNSSGELILHDGTNNGDDRPAFITNRDSKNFRVSIPGVDIGGGPLFIQTTELCAFPLAAAEVANGKIFTVIGQVHLNYGSTGAAPNQYGICIYTDTDVPDFTPSYFHLFEGAVSVSGLYALMNLSVILSMSTASAYQSILCSSSSKGLLQTLHSGAVVNNIASETGGAINPPRLLTGVASEIKIGFFQYSYTPGTLREMLVTGRLDITRQ